MGRRSNGEGPLAKRKDGRRQAAYTVAGKRHYVYGKTRREVAKKLKEALSEVAGAYYPDIEVEESVRARTYERYESICRVHLIPYFGDRKLADHTEMGVQSFYRELLGSGCSPRTVQ